MRERVAHPPVREFLTFPQSLTSMASMRRSLSTLLICLLLCSALVTAFHHHEDGAAHSDCPICVAGQHQPAVPPDAPSGVVRQEAAGAAFVASVTAQIAAIAFSPLQSRAPPL